MYSTCLFCNRSLGENETFETFPVGRRLAFDPAKGRLWVVCRHCERWNLTPLEERWETIERAEAIYRDTRRRVATDQIGLAKLREGTELVRIGAPLRPEFAAWRYGDQFGRRRRRQILLAGVGIGAVGALFAGVAAAGVSIGAFGWMFSNFGRTAISGDPEKVVARILTEKGQVSVRRRHLKETALALGEDGRLAINLRFINGSARYEGEEAQRIASIVVPHTNRYGGAKATVVEAVDTIERAGGPEGFLERIAQTAGPITQSAGARTRRLIRGYSAGSATGLLALTQVERLALEMSLHEEAERRAMQGELAVLERAWREAEEVAGIADNMLMPAAVQDAFERIRSRR